MPQLNHELLPTIVKGIHAERLLRKNKFKHANVDLLVWSHCSKTKFLSTTEENFRFLFSL